MGRKVRAFFCKSEYYLLPDGYTENELPDSGVLSVVRLKTERCAPPDFAEEDTERTEFFFGEQPVFFLDATLYSRAEYDALQAQAAKTACADCQALCGAKQDPLCCGGMLSLNGDCYLKSREKEENFGLKIIYFLCSLAKRTEELERMIEAGEKKKAEKQVQQMLGEFFFPLETYLGTDENGFYALCFTGNLFSAEGFSAVTKAIAETANAYGSPLYKKKWRIYPYFPKGIFKPELKPDYMQRPPKLFYSVNEDTEDIEVAVYEKGADGWSQKTAKRKNDALYKYLCYALGEDIILAGTHTVKICGEPPTDKTPVSAEELHGLLKAHVMELYGEYPFPAPFFLRPTTSNGGAFYPYKEDPVAWVTICPEFPPEAEEESEDWSESEKDLGAFMRFLAGGGAFEAMGIGYAYVYLPYEEGLNYEKREVFEDWLLDYLEKKNEPGFGAVLKLVGIVKTDVGECMDIMVFDEKAFFNAMKEMAPMLEGMKAKIVTVKNGQTVIYNAGYEIRPADAKIYS